MLALKRLLAAKVDIAGYPHHEDVEGQRSAAMTGQKCEIQISRAAARRFLVRSFALEGFQGLPDVATAVGRLQFVQEDSINVCGRIHDLILWARVQDYAPADLHRALYEPPRQAFEYYFPNLSVLPIDDYAHFARAMQARRTSPGRWHGLMPDEIPVAERLLAAIDADGPLRTRRAGAEDGHTTSGWGTKTTVAARVVEKLWLQGHLTVSHRANFERWFDRTERLLPHVADLDLPHPDDETRFRAWKRLRARRLFRRKAADRATLGDDAFVTVTLTDAPPGAKPWFALAEDADALREAEEKADMAESATDADREERVVHFLAPLDPLVYDRERNRVLWDFDYTWEVYTPAAKRRWGYYVLPILRGDHLIGRMDPKFDRKTGTLTLHSLTFEHGIDWREATRAIAVRLHVFARWLGARAIDLSPTVLPQAQRRLLEKLQ